MPKYIFRDSENLSYEPIPEGEYPFEVVSAEEKIRRDGKTAGSETLELKIAAYKDASFRQKLAEWKEQLIFHPSCTWKIDTFSKCVGLVSSDSKDQEIELSADMMPGLRGWCKVILKDGTKDPTKQFNAVSVWYTDRDKISPRRIDASDVPPAAPSVTHVPDDDLNWQ